MGRISTGGYKDESKGKAGGVKEVSGIGIGNSKKKH